MRCVQEMCGRGKILLRLVTKLRCTDFRIWMVRSHLYQEDGDGGGVNVGSTVWIL